MTKDEAKFDPQPKVVRLGYRWGNYMDVSAWRLCFDDCGRNEIDYLYSMGITRGEAIVYFEQIGYKNIERS